MRFTSAAAFVKPEERPCQAQPNGPGQNGFRSLLTSAAQSTRFHRFREAFISAVGSPLLPEKPCVEWRESKAIKFIRLATVTSPVRSTPSRKQALKFILAAIFWRLDQAGQIALQNCPTAIFNRSAREWIILSRSCCLLTTELFLPAESSPPRMAS